MTAKEERQAKVSKLMDTNKNFGWRKIARLIPGESKNTVKADFYSIRKRGIPHQNTSHTQSIPTDGNTSLTPPPISSDAWEREDNDLARWAFRNAKRSRNEREKIMWGRLRTYMSSVRAVKERAGKDNPLVQINIVEVKQQMAEKYIAVLVKHISDKGLQDLILDEWEREVPLNE